MEPWRQRGRGVNTRATNKCRARMRRRLLRGKANSDPPGFPTGKSKVQCLQFLLCVLFAPVFVGRLGSQPHQWRLGGCAHLYQNFPTLPLQILICIFLAEPNHPAWLGRNNVSKSRYVCVLSAGAFLDIVQQLSMLFRRMPLQTELEIFVLVSLLREIKSFQQTPPTVKYQIPCLVYQSSLIKIY